MPRMYPFITGIKADYLISSHFSVDNFIFIIKANAQGELKCDFLCCSIFEKGDRDYETNQKARTLMKKELLIFQIIQKQNPMFHNSTTSFGRWFFSAIPRMRWCELSEVNSQWMPRSNWCPHIPRFWYRSSSGACTRCLCAWTNMGSSAGSTLPLAAAPFFFFVFFNHILFSNARPGKWRISVFGSIGPDPRP